MGAKLVSYYEYIEKVAGREGKVKLAQMTRVPSMICAGQPDDAPTLQRFRDAIEQLTGKPAPP